MNHYSRHCSFAFMVLCSLFMACSPDHTETPLKEAALPEERITELPAIKTEVVTYPVIDSVNNKTLGYGFDIKMGEAGNIRQPTIPAVQGIRYFETEDLAQKAGDLMAEKIKKSGGLSPLTLEDLKSIGINP